MIKRTAFLLIFLLAFPVFSLFSNTIYVYIEKGILLTEENNIIKEWIYSIESGIMDTLFINDHIVFSDNSAENQIDDIEKLNQLAKRGGADVLFTTVLNIKQNVDEIIFSGDFILYNLYKDEIIFTGTYSENENVSISPDKVREKIFLTGKNIGKRVVEYLY